jgi:hypothetical protein
MAPLNLLAFTAADTEAIVAALPDVEPWHALKDALQLNAAVINSRGSWCCCPRKKLEGASTAAEAAANKVVRVKITDDFIFQFLVIACFDLIVSFEE